MLAGISQAVPIDLFRIVHVEGEMISRYLLDGLDTKAAGSSSIDQTQINRRQEINMRLSSYFYHPNLITLDLSGGPVFEQSMFEQNSLDVDQEQVDFALSARATFLREKPYRGALFFNKSHPTLQVGFAVTATTNNFRYGGEVDLLAPFTPIPMHLDMSREENETRGSIRRSENDIDRVNFRATRELGDYGSTSLLLHTSQQRTSAQNPGLSPQTSSFDDQGVTIDTRLKLGDKRQYDLVNSVVINRQQVDLSLGDTPDRNEFRVSTDLRGHHSEKLRSYASLLHDTDDRGTVDRRRNRVTVGANYQPRENLWLTGGVRGDRSDSQALTNSNYGIDGSVRYDRDLPIGSASFGYGLRHDRRSQSQNNADLEIIGEQLSLTGLGTVSLSQPRVVTSTVIVSNLTRTEIFIEGIDYELTLVGTETRIRRLAGGAILDSEQVLIDYSIAVGGSFRSAQTDQNVSIIWHIFPNLNLQYQGNFSRPKILSGEPTFELNKVRSHLYTIHGDYRIPTMRDMLVGGRAEYETRVETIESFTRNSVELFVQSSLPIFRSANLRLGMRRTSIGHDDAIGDSDFRSIEMNLSSRHRYEVNISFDASYEEDLADNQDHSRLRAALRARARYRQLSFNGEIVYTRDRQGNFDRNRTHLLFEVRRTFF